MLITIREVSIDLERKPGWKKESVSIVMPAYNVGRKILYAISNLEREIKNVTDDYEIIVVDDGSNDNTYDLIMDLRNPRVKIIRNMKNMGKGYSVKRGVLASTGQYVLMADADMEISYKDIEKYIRILKYFDIIIGSKRHPDSIYIAPISRKILSLCFNMIVRLLTGIKVSDTQTGFKAFRGDAIRKIMNLVLVKRYAFDVEILAVANLLGMKIYEMPVKIELGRGFAFKSILYMLIDLLGIVYRLRIIKWYQRNLENQSPNYKPILNM